jgi:hypothetical protein
MVSLKMKSDFENEKKNKIKIKTNFIDSFCKLH